jgi:hypothetical protein
MALRQRLKGLMLAATVLACILSATAALAAPISYTITGTGTGTWGGDNFTSAFFSITLSGDTSNVSYNSQFGVWENKNLWGNIDIDGMSYGFYYPMDVILNHAYNQVGFAAMSWPDCMMNLFKSGVNLDTYELKTSFGPVTNPDSGNLHILNTPTSWGPLTFSEVQTASLTFSANTNAVPSPATVLLLGSGLLSLMGYGWSKGRGSE